VAALTSQLDATLYPTEVPIRAPDGGLATDSAVLLNQIRSIDGQRLVRRLGRLSSETMRRVDRALALSLGLLEL
jgi:mRNA interferase MazF